MPTYTVMNLDEFQQQLRTEGNKKIVVIMYGKWERYTLRTLQVFRDLSEEDKYQKFYTFFELETDEHPDVFAYCKNKIIPHVIIFQGQQKLDEIIGRDATTTMHLMLNQHRFT